MSASTNRESDRFMLRLPDGMRERIKVAAEASGRSMNAEILAVLSEKFPEPHDPEFEAMFERVMKIAPEKLERLLKELIDKDMSEGKFTEQDVEDGLLPGVEMRWVPADD